MLLSVSVRRMPSKLDPRTWFLTISSSFGVAAKATLELIPVEAFSIRFMRATVPETAPPKKSPLLGADIRRWLCSRTASWVLTSTIVLSPKLCAIVRSAWPSANTIEAVGLRTKVLCSTSAFTSPWSE